MNIKRFQKIHLEQAAELYVSVFNSDPWNESWSRERAAHRIRWFFEAPGFLGYALFRDLGLVGVVFGNSRPFQDYDDFEIYELFIQSDSQRKGLGKILMNAISAELQSRNTKHIILQTGRNTPAYQFYASLGYKESERIVGMVKAI